MGDFEASSAVVLRCGDPRESQTFFSYAHLIEYDERKILVDTGFGEPSFCLKHLHAVCHSQRDLPVRELYAEYGVDTDKIDTVILTHCHWDHMGNIDLFPNARIFCQRKELEWAFTPPAWLSDGYPAAFAEKLSAARGQLEIIDGDFTLAPGIRLRLAGGHTPGSQMVEVRGPRGRVIITGGLVFKYENLEKFHPPGSYFNLQETVSVIQSLLSEQKEDPHLTIFPVHDPLVWSRHQSGIEL